MFVAFWTMFFGLGGLITWAVLHHRATVFNEFSSHLERFHLSGLMQPDEVIGSKGFLGPDSYSSRAHLADGATMSDVAAALKAVPGCETEFDESTA